MKSTAARATIALVAALAARTANAADAAPAAPAAADTSAPVRQLAIDCPVSVIRYEED